MQTAFTSGAFSTHTDMDMQIHALSACLSVGRSPLSVCRSVCMCLSVCLSPLSVFLSVCLSPSLFLFLSVSVSVSLCMSVSFFYTPVLTLVLSCLPLICLYPPLSSFLPLSLNTHAHKCEKDGDTEYQLFFFLFCLLKMYFLCQKDTGCRISRQTMKS